MKLYAVKVGSFYFNRYLFGKILLSRKPKPVNYSDKFLEQLLWKTGGTLVEIRDYYEVDK